MDEPNTDAAKAKARASVHQNWKRARFKLALFASRMADRGALTETEYAIFLQIVRRLRLREPSSRLS